MKTKPKQFEPPAHLSNRSKALWASVIPTRGRSAGRLAMTQSALESLDRADEASAAIKTAGMTSITKTTGAVHVHPLVKVERESRQQFARIWQALNFGFDPAIDGISLDRAMKRLKEDTDDALTEMEAQQ